MTFDGIIEALGGRLGAEIENAGGAAAVEIDGAVVVLQDAAEMSASDDLAAQANVMERRFKPLTRAEVREILDDYANGGRGFGKAQEEIGISYANYMAGQATRNMSDKDRAKQARVNTANALNHEVKHDPTLLQRVALVSCNSTIRPPPSCRSSASSCRRRSTASSSRWCASRTPFRR